MITLLRFSGRHDWLAQIKGLPSIRCTRTHGCYYIDYDLGAFNAFVNLQIPYRLPQPYIDNSIGTAQGSQAAQRHTDIAPDTPSQPSSPIDTEQQAIADIHHSRRGDLEIAYRDRYFHITTPYHKPTVALIKRLHKAYWHKKHQKWLCYASLENLSRIQQQWQCWTPHQVETLTTAIKAYDKGTAVTIYQIPAYPKEVVVEITGYRQLQAPLRRCKNRRYDHQHKRWYIPYESSIIEQVITDYKELGITVDNRLPEAHRNAQPVQSNGDRAKKLLRKVPDRSKALATTMIDHMIIRRNSWRTIEQYTKHLTKYYTYLHEHYDGQTSQARIDSYMAMLSKSKVSDSLLNLVASALKYYYKHVETGISIDINLVKRPIQASRLPAILSTKQMLRLIEASGNIKHRNIVFTLYSGGLRLSELLDLELKDINWDRGQIFIRGGKGKKDRVVMLSSILSSVLQAYFHTYKPAIYLFESTKPGQKYSTSSVQKVVRRAKKIANINAKVTPHTLRHSFATHLHDEGISIVHIQALLGHKQLKTTMIYTHISTNDTTRITSPLDRLMGQKEEKYPK